MKNNIDKCSCNIKEIFLSIQGEGPYIGYRQLFIRFCGCNLNCNYCDTDFTIDNCKIEQTPGSNDFIYSKNPQKRTDLLEIINNFKDFHSISLTGGEPLVSVEFLKEFLPKLNHPAYLETNGTLPYALEQIIDHIWAVSMDIKIPSSTKEKSYMKEHLDFIDITIKNKKEIFAKAVVTSQITDEEIKELLNISKKVPLIIQPITTKDKALVLDTQTIFKISNKIPNARIIPQAHNYIGIL